MLYSPLVACYYRLATNSSQLLSPGNHPVSPTDRTRRDVHVQGLLHDLTYIIGVLG